MQVIIIRIAIMITAIPWGWEPFAFGGCSTWNNGVWQGETLYAYTVNNTLHNSNNTIALLVT